MTTRYEQAATHRQNALDYIIAHPGATAPEIINALNWHNKAVGSDRPADMVERGELSRKKATITVINAAGTRSVINTYAYTARTNKTKSADKMASAVTANLAADKTAPAPNPGRTVHIGGTRRDLVNQRGQGALSPSPRRGCSLGKF